MNLTPEQEELVRKFLLLWLLEVGSGPQEHIPKKLLPAATKLHSRLNRGGDETYYHVLVHYLGLDLGTGYHFMPAAFDLIKGEERETPP